jgi:Protein of unknown function (DUF1549)/Protein of unknown function (DUF1553)
MTRLRWWPAAFLALLLTAQALPAAPGGTPPAEKDVQALAALIDRYIAAGWEKATVKPAPIADDGEFLRRVYLQLAGRIPSVSEVRTFLADRAPGKRRRVVIHLLQHPRYVTHFTNVWRSWMLPEASASFQARFLVPGFESWLRKQFAENVAYDRMVHELLTTPLSQRQAQFINSGGGQANPSAFYIAKEVKPENVAAATSRLFLGVRLECAQCHNHPFASWKRDQFWQYAAFFSGLRRQGNGDFAQPGQETPDSKEITIPGTERVIQAKFLDGSDPKWKYKEPVRKTLADWVTSPRNPYFAKATVNRLWEYFFGTGLVDPVDEMAGTDKEPSHPELLDELAKQFVAHQFDLKYLIRAITASKAYQLSSRQTAPGQADPRLFARMPLRGMTAEQLFDSVAEATGYRDGAARTPPGVVVGGRGNPRDQFLSRFADQTGRPVEFQTSILQALSMMNGKLIEDATGLGQSETLLAVVDNPFMTTEERIETLYLAVLSRSPRAKELSKMVHYVASEGSSESRPGARPLVEDSSRRAGRDSDKTEDETERQQRSNRALADVFWVLLNSGEFLLKQ